MIKCINEDLKSCGDCERLQTCPLTQYDTGTSVEIRLYDHAKNRILYKYLSVIELAVLEELFGKEWSEI